MTVLNPIVLGAELTDAAGSGAVTGLNDVVTRLEAGTFFWLDLTGSSTKQVTELAEVLTLTEDSSEHLRNAEQRSAFEVSHNGIRAVAYGVGDEQQLVEVHVVYTASFLVTVHQAPCPALGEARDLYRRLRDHDQGDAPLVLFMVLDALVASFHAVLGHLDAALDELEVAVLGGIPVPDYLTRILEIRRTLTPIVRALGPYHSDLVGMLGAIQRLPGMGSGAQEYFDSHRSHVAAVFEDANDCRDETRDALQVHSSTAAERQGQVINWLTVVAAIFLPLTFVTGYFGMNFRVITGLRGWPIFLALGVALPGLLAITSVIVLQRLIRRLGVRFLPAPRPHESRRPAR